MTWWFFDFLDKIESHMKRPRNRLIALIPKITKTKITDLGFGQIMVNFMVKLWSKIGVLAIKSSKIEFFRRIRAQNFCHHELYSKTYVF